MRVGSMAAGALAREQFLAVGILGGQECWVQEKKAGETACPTDFVGHYQ
jgi:hypothetical protein